MTSEKSYIFLIPNDINSVSELFNAYAVGLNAPNNYFGNNWDSFFDSLMNLNWIKEKSIILVHQQLPAINKSELRIYLDILNDAVERWSDNDQAETLKEQFPTYRTHLLQLYFTHTVASEVNELSV